MYLNKQSEERMAISIGDRIPSSTLQHKGPEGVQQVLTDDIFRDKKVILVSAFIQRRFQRRRDFMQQPSREMQVVIYNHPCLKLINHQQKFSGQTIVN